MNNPYGALLVAEEQLSIRIKNSQGQEIRMLDWGKGFFSKKEGCDASGNNCKITGPGTAIENQLNEALGTGQQRLIVADEMNELLGALFAQLANQALSGVGGLLGLTPNVSGAEGIVPYATTTYFDQMANDTTVVGNPVSSQNPIQDAILSLEAYIDKLTDVIVDPINEVATYKDTTYGPDNQCSPDLNRTLEKYRTDALA